jgi:hypothetical protein
VKEGGGKTKDKGERKLRCKINAKRGKIKSKRGVRVHFGMLWKGEKYI